MKRILMLLTLTLVSVSFAGSPPFILPSQTGNSGKVLGTNGTVPSWVAPPSGTVTSVTASSPLAASPGTTPNITIQAADATHNGYLSLGDWSLFNSKQDALLFSLPLVNSSGTISIPPATSSANGYLTSSDWSIFNSKQAAGSYVTTARSVATTSPLSGGGTLSSDLTLSMPVASSSASGYLSSSDWSTFNAKQPAGSYVTTARTVSTSAPLTGGGSLASDLTLAMPAATSLVNGYLTSSDWSLFNGKQSALTFGSISTSTTGISIANGADSTVGPNVTVNVQTASGSQPGLLSAADWSTFNGKQSALTLGNLTAPGTDGIAVTGGTGSVVGSGASIAQQASDATHNGYLTSSDWSTFNAKQAAGSYLTALTSDVSASGPGSAAATVNSVGGSTASAVNTATVLANAATSLNTANAIMKRGSSGEVAAGVGTFTGLSVATLPAQQMYVTKDNGNDANDCSMFKPCKTIQAGINAANAIAAYYKPVVLHVAPSFGGTGSSYNENITFSQQGVNLVCDAPQASQRACQISGTVTVNMTGTSGGANFVAASNEAYMNGFVVGVNSSGATLTFSGTTFQRFILLNSYIDQNGTGNAVVMSNSGTSGGSASLLKVFDSDINNSNATAPAVDLQAGKLWLYGTTSTISNGNAAGPSVTQSGATSSLIANLVQVTGQFNLTSNTATATFNLSTINSGANPCIVTPSSANTGYALLAYFGCTSTNTNSFTGSGVLVNAPANIRTSTSGDAIGTITQTAFPPLPQGPIQIQAGAAGAGATTVTNALVTWKNGHLVSQQTTAPTRTLSGNAGTGGTPSCTLTNATDSAGKIALVTGTSAWASGTQCTVTFNKAHTTAPICVVSPNNASAASKAVSQQINFTTTTTTLLVSFGAADTAQTTYNWMYQCMETQ